ncbi:MAG: hypothetical protein Q9222_004184 [Ikaeria aurantiellina]
MGGSGRSLLLEDSLDRRVVTFSDDNRWQLTKKLSEKPWAGSYEDQRGKDEDWQPHEAHAIYECIQIRGPRIGMLAIMKVRIDDDPNQRGKDASGMRLNSASENEIEILQRLTAAHCSVTPSLLAFKIDAQDDSVLSAKGKPKFGKAWGESKRWWMPGGYIVYILMTKLNAEPLDINAFWAFSRQQRDDIRRKCKISV